MRLSITSLIVASAVTATAFAGSRPAEAGLAAVLPCSVGTTIGKHPAQQRLLYPHVTNTTGSVIPGGSIISVTVTSDGRRQNDDIDVPAGTSFPPGLVYQGAGLFGLSLGATCSAGLVGRSGPTYGSPSIPPRTTTGHPKPVLQ